MEGDANGEEDNHANKIVRWKIVAETVVHRDEAWYHCPDDDLHALSACSEVNEVSRAPKTVPLKSEYVQGSHRRVARHSSMLQLQSGRPASVGILARPIQVGCEQHSVQALRVHGARKQELLAPR